MIKNLVNDLDKSLRDIGIPDMSIGKYVKRYVKKFYYRLKILDPIFENDNYEELLNYVNSIELINKNKKGFAIPIEKWMKSTLKTEINDLFASDLIKKDELISQKFILNECQKFQSNNKPQNTNLIWSTLIYLKWKNKWFG